MKHQYLPLNANKHKISNTKTHRHQPPLTTEHQQSQQEIPLFHTEHNKSPPFTVKHHHTNSCWCQISTRHHLEAFYFHSYCVIVNEITLGTSAPCPSHCSYIRVLEFHVNEPDSVQPDALWENKHDKSIYNFLQSQSFMFEVWLDSSKTGSFSRVRRVHPSGLGRSLRLLV